MGCQGYGGERDSAFAFSLLRKGLGMDIFLRRASCTPYRTELLWSSARSENIVRISLSPP